MKTNNRERRDIRLILVILLLGLLFMLCSGQAAIQLVPKWRLTDVDMNSAMNPDEAYTPFFNEIIEPILPDVLTPPAWLEFYLTPNAIIPTSIIYPTRTSIATPINTLPPTSFILTNTPVITVPPTSTISIPPTRPPQTSVPPTKAPPPTSVPPTPSANLAIAKSDGTPVYVPGNPINYQIVVTNAGPDAATGFNITDAVPAAITGLTVSCAVGGTASCGADASNGNNVSFTGVSVNAGTGNSVTISISGTVAVGTSGNLSNTASIVIPGSAGFNDPNTSNNTATDTDTETLVADLSITKTNDTATQIVTEYGPGAKKTYYITVSNVAGPSNVTGATVTDNFPNLLTNITWTCIGNGTTCTASGAGNIIDTINLPVGSSVTYTAVAYVISSASGNLVNTATVDVPAGYTDPDTSNNTATDTDTPIITNPPPGGEVGTTRDGNIYDLQAGETLTLLLPNPIVPSGDSTPDMVYYEYLNGGTVYLDWVIIEIGDGNTWYTVFNWGDDLPNPAATPIVQPTPNEIDEEPFAPGQLYNISGITLDVDAVGVPAGSYYWVRVYAPINDVDGQLEIDGIGPYP